LVEICHQVTVTFSAAGSAGAGAAASGALVGSTAAGAAAAGSAGAAGAGVAAGAHAESINTTTMRILRNLNILVLITSFSFLVIHWAMRMKSQNKPKIEVFTSFKKLTMRRFTGIAHYQSCRKFNSFL
jgi:hypothetical protein